MQLTFEEALKELGLKPGYTAVELKKAFHKKSKNAHPDLNPNDPNAAEKMKRINCANETLSRYLENPSLIEQEQKKEKAKKEKEQRERAKQRAEKEKRERARREQIDKLYNIFSKVDPQIPNRQDFEKNFSVWQALYKMALDIYKNKEKIISDYNKNHHERKENIIDIVSNSRTHQRNKDKKNQKDTYAQKINTEFATLEKSLSTIITRYDEYYRYQTVLNNGIVSSKSFTSYVLGDEEVQTKEKTKAYTRFQKLSNLYFETTIPKIEDINLAEEIKNRTEDINLINRIEAYVEKTYAYSTYYYTVLYIQATSNKNIAETIKKEVENIIFKGNEHKTSITKEHIIAFMYYRLKTINFIYSKIPLEQFNISKTPVEESIYKFLNSKDIVTKYLKLAKYPNITECYSIYIKNKNNPRLPEELKSKKASELLEIIIKREQKIPVINGFGQDYTLEELLFLTEKEFNKLVSDSEKRKKEYEQMLKLDETYSTYHDIYQKYKNQFSSLSFNQALEKIKARCDYIRSLHITGELIDLYSKNDDELKKLKATQVKRNKIKFILENNPQFTNAKENKVGLGFELSILKEEEFNKLYKETYLRYINDNNPKFKEHNMSSYYYDTLSEEERDSILSTTRDDILLRNMYIIINKYRELNRRSPVTIEEIKENELDYFIEYTSYLHQEHEKREAQTPKDKKGTKK